MFTGKELFDAFGGLSKSMDALDRIAKGHVPCKKCGATGYHAPSRWSSFVAWINAFPFRLRFGRKPQSANTESLNPSSTPEKSADIK